MRRILQLIFSFSSATFVLVVLSLFSKEKASQPTPESAASIKTIADSDTSIASNNQKLIKEQADELDTKKPTYTKSSTIVCPANLLLSADSDHSGGKIAEMFNSIWNRGEKAKELGCTELTPGIPLTVSSSNGTVVYVKVPLNDNSQFTLEDELTNKVPGQSDAQREELGTPHVYLEAATGTPLPSTTVNSPARLLVSLPSRAPIPTGNVVVKSDLGGFGTVICPNTDTLAAFFDSQDASLSQATPHFEITDLQGPLRYFGCSYFPPGTTLVSLGANEAGSLIVVSKSLSDGSTIKGVSLPSSYVPQ